MSAIDLIAKAGGIFAALTFVHFFSDWIFQSHDAAMAKATNASVRALHCVVYATFFVPLMLLMMSPTRTLLGWGILFLSHFGEDTYFPVFIWAVLIRKPIVGGRRLATVKDFKEWMGTGTGFLLGVAIDQIVHLLFLWTIVALALVG